MVIESAWNRPTQCEWLISRGKDAAKRGQVHAGQDAIGNGTYSSIGPMDSSCRR